MRVSIAEFKTNGGLGPMVAGTPDDLILLSCSFEPRSWTILENLAHDYQAAMGIAYLNEDFYPERRPFGTNSEFDHFKHKLARHTHAVRPAKGVILEPKVQLGSFQAIFSKLGGPDDVKNITIDATTFNRETLLILLGLTDTFFPKSRKRIVYVSPAGYGSWLSGGFQQVRNVIGLSGLQDPSKKTLLVVLYGYESHRALKTIEEYEPSKVLLGFGGTPTDIDFLKRNRDELDQVKALTLSQQETEDFEFPADSIANCAMRLEEVVEPLFAEYNVVITPMSTKLSTIAAYLVAKKFPQIQISYCVPGEYNTADYSHGAKTVFIEELAST
jgi:hypothetical protein